MIEIYIEGSPSVLMRIDLVLNTVKACHKDRCICKIRVTSRVGISEFEAAHIGRLGISGNTDDRTSVGCCVTDRYGCLKTGNKTFKGIGARIGKRAERIDMLKQSAHEIVCRLAQVRITLIIRKDGFISLHQEHMNMHSASCLTVNGLRHKGCAHSVFLSGIFDYVFDKNGCIRHLSDFTEKRFDLELTAGTDLGMVILNGNTCLFDP